MAKRPAATVSRAPDGKPVVTVESVDQLRDWLAATDRDGLWLATWKKTADADRYVSYDDAVRTLLCFGWVDSKSGRLDEQRTMMWIARRKSGSGWSKSNKDRVADLRRDGLMTAAGEAVIAAAEADGSWGLLDAVERLEVPTDLAAAFADHPPAQDNWDAFPRSARRGILEWIVQAKRPETRVRRIEETAVKAARGERANQWSPPDAGAAT